MKLTKDNLNTILSSLEEGAVLWIQFQSLLRGKVNFLISRDNGGQYRLMLFENDILQLVPQKIFFSGKGEPAGRSIKEVAEILSLYLRNNLLCECCFLNSLIA